MNQYLYRLNIDQYKYFFLILMFSSTSIKGQDIDWYIEPIITDVHGIWKVDEKDSLLFVEDGNENFGIKDFRNKWIVPVKYKGFNLLPELGAIQALSRYGAGPYDYYDYDGNLIEPISKYKVKHELNKIAFKKKMKLLEELTINYPGIHFEIVKKDLQPFQHREVAFNAINSEGDTIIKDIKKSISNRGLNRLYNKGRLYNLKGQLIFDFGELIPYDVFKNGWFTAFDPRTEEYLLFDDKYNLIESSEERMIRLEGSGHFVTDRNFGGKLQYFLHTFSGHQVNEEGVDYIEEIKGCPCYLLYKRDDQFWTYCSNNQNFNKSKFLLGKPLSHERLKDRIQAVKQGSNYGVIDLCTEEIILPPQFGYVRVYRNYIVTAPKNMKKGKGAFNNYSFWDRKGKLLNTLYSVKPSVLDEYIILKSEKEHILVDEEFKILMHFDNNFTFGFNRITRSIYKYYAEKNDRVIYLLTDLIRGIKNPYKNF